MKNISRFYIKSLAVMIICFLAELDFMNENNNNL